MTRDPLCGDNARVGPSSACLVSRSGGCASIWAETWHLLTKAPKHARALFCSVHIVAYLSQILTTNVQLCATCDVSNVKCSHCDAIVLRLCDCARILLRLCCKFAPFQLRGNRCIFAHLWSREEHKVSTMAALCAHVRATILCCGELTFTLGSDATRSRNHQPQAAERNSRRHALESEGALGR